MEPLLIKLTELGITGVIAAVLLYDVFYLQKRLLQIIENNTMVMTDLKSYCSNNMERMRESKAEGSLKLSKK